MIERSEFDELVDEIVAQGFSEHQAAEFAGLIGDRPEIDREGKVVVRDGTGTVLARLRLKFFGE